MWVIAILLVTVSMMLFALRLSQSGLSARTRPRCSKDLWAKQVRVWLVPVTSREATNPLPINAEILKQGMDHWADHCATCHANDGSGETEMGRNFYPPAPDMRTVATQSLTDGELYYAIRNGVPLTGMPAWGDPNLGDSDTQTCHSFAICLLWHGMRLQRWKSSTRRVQVNERKNTPKKTSLMASPPQKQNPTPGGTMKRSFIAIWMLLILAVSAWAHGDEQHVMGTVLKHDGMNITVKTQDGNLKTVMVTSETEYLKANSAAKLEDIKVGDRVVIHVKKMGDMLHATEVKIGAAENASVHQH